MLKRVEVKEKVILHTITIVVAYILRIDERTFKKTKKIYLPQETIALSSSLDIFVKYDYYLFFVAGCPSLRIRRRGTTARLKVCRRRSDRPCSSELRLQPYNNHDDHSPSAVTDHCSISSSADSVEHPCAVDYDRVIFLNSAFLQQSDESNPKVPQQQRNNVLVPAILKASLMMLLVILLVNFPSAGKPLILSYPSFFIRQKCGSKLVT